MILLIRDWLEPGRRVARTFAADARQANRALIGGLTEIATRLRATPAEVALAWVLAQKPWIVPPGTRKLDRLEENIGAASVTLTAGDLRDINDLTTTIEVQGACYPEHLERMTNL